MKKFFIGILALFTINFIPAIANDKEITNLKDYFEYLPNEVHKNWTPYKANEDYLVRVQFRIKKNGEITHPIVIKTTNVKANASVINAVNTGAPYKNLPKSYTQDSIKTQVELRYIKQ